MPKKVKTPDYEATSGHSAGIHQRHVIDTAGSEVYRIQWSNDGQKLAIPNANRDIAIWDINQREPHRHLSGHTDRVYDVSWSPADTNQLASVSRDGRVLLWDVVNGIVYSTFQLESRANFSVAWSPDGRNVASATRNTVFIIDVHTGQIIKKLLGHSQSIYCVAWSPDGKVLVSGSADSRIVVWSALTWQKITVLEDHSSGIIDVAWSPDGTMLASGSADCTVRLWDTQNWRAAVVLEGHSRYVNAVSFAADARFLASKSGDDTVKIWSTGDWKLTHTIAEKRGASGPYLSSLQFHPHMPILATLGEDDVGVRLWGFNPPAMLTAGTSTQAVHYVNAKVVLVGDSGVGKSGLGLVLCNRPFEATDSTHNRHVYSFDTQTEEHPDMQITRETLLWDLAGQPGYRLTNQLHLNDVSVALVVYDSRHEIDPFSGVVHWVKALRQAQKMDEGGGALKIFLVAARTDRGVVGISQRRIEQFMNDMGIERHFNTSAKEGWGVAELREAVREAIAWDALPRVSSTRLFDQIKRFIVSQSEAGAVLVDSESLRTMFAMAQEIADTAELKAQFETCINLLIARGLIERLTFGDLILLQPEMLDAYASALVNAAKDQADGLGYIAEADVLNGNFKLPSALRLQNKKRERVFLSATLHKILQHEVALREQTDAGAFIVFPSQFTRQAPDLSGQTGQKIRFAFEGSIIKIYTTLVVRLAQTGFFALNELWQNAALFTSTSTEAQVGLFLQMESDSEGELLLFFDDDASDYVRYQFEEYVQTHLRRRAFAGSVRRMLSLTCECGYTIPDEVIALRKSKRHTSVNCPICARELSLLDGRESAEHGRRWIKQMNVVANRERDKAAASSTLSGKQMTEDFDVFLCYNSHDRELVKRIGLALCGLGLHPWLDEWELRPGKRWQDLLSQQISKIKSAAVFVGGEIGPWQNMEIEAFLDEFIKRGCPVIPVILESCVEAPKLPPFLRNITWVDFRQSTPNPLERLKWGITGEKTPRM